MVPFDDADGAPAASPEGVDDAVDDGVVVGDEVVVDDEAVDEAMVDTALALSGGRSEPETVENAWCVATLSGAIAKSK